MRQTILVATSFLALACAVLPSCKKPTPGGADGGGDAGPAATASLAFLTGFEGEIDGFVKDEKTSGGQQTPIAVMIKNAKIRFEVPEALAKSAPANPLGDKGYVIVDTTAKKLFFVSDAKKEAIELDINSAGKAMQGAHPTPGPHGAAPQAPPTKVTKTGKTETVAGYTCEDWDIASDHKEGTVCMASDGPSWLSLPTTGIPSDQAWMLDLLDGKHFPLRYVVYGKDGATEESRVEVTKIDKKPQQDSEFQVPAGYKTIDLEKMLSGFGIPGGGMPGIPGNLPVPPHPPPHGH
jgi:hypothetical protein